MITKSLKNSNIMRKIITQKSTRRLELIHLLLLYTDYSYANRWFHNQYVLDYNFFCIHMQGKILKKYSRYIYVEQWCTPTYGIHIQHYDSEILLIELKRPYLFTFVQIFSMCKHISILP